MKSDTTEALLKQLKDPFDPKFIKWRVGQKTKDGKKATALAYLDAREVYKRLDDVCGLDGWSVDHVGMANGFICKLSLKMPDGTWVTKSDASGLTNVEGVKGGASTAVKRAAAVWGIGRYLYYIPKQWVEIDQYGNFIGTPVLPEWAKPNPNVARWEDVAELEADMQGADAEFEGDRSIASLKSEKVQENLARAKAA